MIVKISSPKDGKMIEHYSPASYKKQQMKLKRTMKIYSEW